MCVLTQCSCICYDELATRQKPHKFIISEEVSTMALSNISGWNEDKNAGTACGTACGASDKPEEKPTACGSACGASDKPEEKPTACGSACGASDK